MCVWFVCVCGVCVCGLCVCVVCVCVCVVCVCVCVCVIVRQKRKKRGVLGPELGRYATKKKAVITSYTLASLFDVRPNVSGGIRFMF